MTQDQVITVAAVLVPCVIALLVGYWHRKQMRQIELFRRDPSVGVLPPPSPPVAFLKRHWDVILGIVFPILNIATFMIRNEPVTVLWVVIINFNVGCIVYTLALRSEIRLLKLIGKMADTMFDQAKLSSVIVKGNEAQMRLTELQEQRLKEIAQGTGEAPSKGE